MVRIEVIIASQKRLVDKPLTYSHSVALQPGQVVKVSIGKQMVKAIVLKIDSSTPKYRLKPILEVFEGIIVPLVLLDLVKSVSVYYGASLSQTAASLLPSALKAENSEKISKVAEKGTEELMPLTDEQSSAIQQIQKSKLDSTVILLGATGSGKTRVYMELAKRYSSKNRGTIILVPEIGLTTQLVQQFSRVFDNVFVIHSSQTPLTRRTMWLNILRHPAPVVVGPRSALFAPVSNLGLIIVDEAHEPAYKQTSTPKYQAQRVARMLASLHKARLVLGTATPSVEDYYLATKLRSPIVKMTKQATGKEHVVKTSIVDLTDTTNQGKLITAPLQKAISQSLSNGLQTLIFHNRRGTSTSVICESCGYVSKCPNCLLPLAHHQDKQLLLCHICNFHAPVSVTCPQCRKAGLKYHGFGTKQIESELQQLFPTARVARFDSDTPQKQGLSQRYEEIISGKIDIIVGTQVVAKGLDLPKLETVGIILADSLLFLPDYSSSERFFQLIYQVIGRVGRHRTGYVVVQTLNPTNPVLLTAINREYQNFASIELEERADSHYPPFTYLLSLTAVRQKLETVTQVSNSLATTLRKKYPKLTVLGPAPAFHERIAGKYRWQIVVKSNSRSTLMSIVQELPSGWTYDIDPNQLLL